MSRDGCVALPSGAMGLSAVSFKNSNFIAKVLTKCPNNWLWL